MGQGRRSPGLGGEERKNCGDGEQKEGALEKEGEKKNSGVAGILGVKGSSREGDEEERAHSGRGGKKVARK